MDIGAVLGEYLRAWLESIPVADAATPAGFSVTRSCRWTDAAVAERVLVGLRPAPPALARELSRDAPRATLRRRAAAPGGPRGDADTRSCARTCSTCCSLVRTSCAVRTRRQPIYSGSACRRRPHDRSTATRSGRRFAPCGDLADLLHMVRRSVATAAARGASALPPSAARDLPRLAHPVQAVPIVLLPGRPVPVGQGRPRPSGRSRSSPRCPRQLRRGRLGAGLAPGDGGARDRSRRATACASACAPSECRARARPPRRERRSSVRRPKELARLVTGLLHRARRRRSPVIGDRTSSSGCTSTSTARARRRWSPWSRGCSTARGSVPAQGPRPPRRFGRCDAAVLYLAAAELRGRAPSLAAVVVGVRAPPAPRAPVFTKPLARGVAVGEHQRWPRRELRLEPLPAPRRGDRRRARERQRGSGTLRRRGAPVRGTRPRLRGPVSGAGIHRSLCALTGRGSSRSPRALADTARAIGDLVRRPLQLGRRARRRRAVARGRPSSGGGARSGPLRGHERSRAVPRRGRRQARRRPTSAQPPWVRSGSRSTTPDRLSPERPRRVVRGADRHRLCGAPVSPGVLDSRGRPDAQRASCSRRGAATPPDRRRPT